MNDLTVFNHDKFGNVRRVDVDGKPGLVASDVAKALGYKDANSAIDQHCRGVVKHLITDSLGRAQLAKVIFKPDLWRLAAQSELPGAEEFESWIYDTVLVAIDETGGYIPTQPEDSESEILAKAFIIANKTIAEQKARLGQLQTVNSKLTTDNAIMQPKAEFFDELVDRNLLTSFRDTAKELKVKEKEFVNFLLNHKYIFRDKKGKLTPYADYKDKNLFEVKECFNEKTNWSGVQTLITPKGRETFRLLMAGLKTA